MRIVTACSLLCVLLASAPASAQVPAREGAAQLLFDEAAKLLERGLFEEACAKFQASQALDPKGGTLLNLAQCRERQGRIATAWTLFAEARNLAAKDGRQDRVTFAEQRMRALEPTLPRVRVTVADRSGREAPSVRLDGAPLAQAAWNVALPMDPGEHELEATRRDGPPFTARFTVAVGQKIDVAVPADDAAVVRERPDAGAAPPPASARAPWLGLGIAGAGGAALAVGTVFGVEALGRRGEAEDLCAQGRCAEGREVRDRGVREAWVANVGITVGVVALAAGLYLVLRGDSARAAARYGSTSFAF